MSFNLEKMISSKIKNIQVLLKPKNLPKLLFLLLVLLILYFIYTTYLKEGFTSDLDPANLDTEIQTGKKLVLFYADWCGHCKKLKPTWEEASEELNTKTETKMLKINCSKQDDEQLNDIMSQYKVKGYPTIIIFDDGKATPYEGERTVEAFKEALSKKSY
jgi:protein disulfide-isomerase-like protein